MELTKAAVSKPGDRSVELFQPEEQRKEFENQNEQILMDLWYSIWSSNIHVIGIPQAKERENGT